MSARSILDVVILAAGKGKRMRSDLPKVLHPLAGRALLAHVLDAARALAPRRVVVVVAHAGAALRAAPRAKLAAWLARLGNDNAQGEYYLTDVVALAAGDGVAIDASPPRSADECLGVNSKADLAALERRHQMNHASRLLEAGVSLADPARLDVRGTLDCGRDVSIDVNCIFEGKVVLGDGA